MKGAPESLQGTLLNGLVGALVHLANLKSISSNNNPFSQLDLA